MKKKKLMMIMMLLVLAVSQNVWAGDLVEKEKIGAVSIIKLGLTYQPYENEMINRSLKEAGIENRHKIVEKLQETSNAAIIFFASQDITNIKVHTITPKKLEQCQWDFETYHKIYGAFEYEVLKDKLGRDEVLIITCLEPEGIPLNYLTWDNMLSKDDMSSKDNMLSKDMWLIQYRGELTII